MPTASLFGSHSELESSSFVATSGSRPTTTSRDIENDGHVEFPQFTSICRALYHNIPTYDIAMLYYLCSRYGNSNQFYEDIASSGMYFYLYYYELMSLRCA